MKKSKALLATVAAAALSTMMAGGASAATFFYSFTSNDGMDGASGTLQASDNGDGTFTATSGTITAFGTVASGAGSLFANPGAPAVQTSPSGGFFYDDQLLPGQNPLISNAGLLFTIAGLEVNIFSNGAGPNTYQFYNQSGANVFGNFALSQVAVPEPATWALMLVGFGMVGAGIRARKRQTVRVTYA